MSKLARNRIKERGIGEDIVVDIMENMMSIAKVAEKYQLKYHEVQRFMRDYKINVYNDDKLEAIAISEEFNPLSVVAHFFQSVHHASKELAFTGVMGQLLREKLAEKLAEGGIEGLISSPENARIVRSWQDNSAKLAKMIELSPKLLTAYIELFSEVLEVQREVSYVKLITDILRQDNPKLYQKIQRALDADPTAKRVLETLKREDVLMYWDSETGQVVRNTLPDDYDEETYGDIGIFPKEE